MPRANWFMERLLSVLCIIATMNPQLGSLLWQGSWKSSRIAELRLGREDEEDSYKSSWKLAGRLTPCVSLQYSIDLWQEAP
jgi:hypothetical protein